MSSLVLVVDDNPMQLKLMRLTLESVGFAVETAVDGTAAFAAIEAHAPDIVLSDVMMPNSDGFTLCRRVRARAEHAALPVVLISSHYVEDGDRALAAKAGASALTSRDIDPETLAELLRTNLGRARAHDPIEFDAAHLARISRQLDLLAATAREQRNLREHQGAALAAVARLSERFGREDDLGRTLEDGLYMLLEVVAARVLAVCCPGPSGGWRLVASVGPQALADTLLARSDVLDRSHATGAHLDFTFERSAGVLIPLRAGGRLVGALMLGCDRPLDPEPLCIVKTIAVQIAQAVCLFDTATQLENTHRRSEALLGASHEAVAMLAMDGTILYVNQRLAEMAMAPRADLVGHNMFEFVAPGHETEFGKGFELTATRSMVAFRRLDGVVRHVELSCTPIEIDGKPRLIAISNDLTDALAATAALQTSEEKYRSLVEHIPDIVWTGTAEGATLEVSSNVTDICGFSEAQLVIGQRPMWLGRVHVDDLARVEAALRAKAIHATPFDLEFRWQHEDGSWIWLHGRSVRAYLRDGAPCLEALFTDTTDRKRVDEQVRLAQKMEAVGQLTGGVAHDFNNILAVILASSEFLLESLDDGDARRDDAIEIEKAAMRAAALTRQLLAFSRRQVLEPTTVDLNGTITELEKMLRRLIGEDIALEFAAAADLGFVRADVGQLEQVIVNLVVNARDAMPTGGRLTIETANVDLDESYATHHVPVTPGRYVMIAVTDTGCGMDAATQARVFEPFFTTKGPGKGTGLGLSTSYGIIKQSGGYIWVYSEPGHGSVFKIYLPRVDCQAAPGLPRAARKSTRGGHETVLLLEDDDAVRVSIHRILTGRGYRVLAAATGDEAIEQVASHLGTIDLILSDVVLPGRCGPDLVRLLHERLPAARVLFMSGYTDHALFMNGVLSEQFSFMQKPFTPEALSNKVREVLAA
jgi:two-component system cell cycle sensor histidine kinase/response regulator CckA